MNADMQALVDALLPILEKHLPSCKQKGFRDWSFIPFVEAEPRSEHYAMHLSLAIKAGSARFGHVETDVTTEDAARALDNCTRVLRGLDSAQRDRVACKLSPSAKLVGLQEWSHFEDGVMLAQMKIGHRTASGVRGEKVSISELSRLMAQSSRLTSRERELGAEVLTNRNGFEWLEALLVLAATSLKEVGKENTDVTVASKKPNWRAASVAGTCRLVWAEEHREISSPQWQEFCKNSGTVLDDPCRQYHFAPMQQHHDTPGPFGRLLNDVFGALKVHNIYGEPVSAAVALRQWKKAQGDYSRRLKH